VRRSHPERTRDRPPRQHADRAAEESICANEPLREALRRRSLRGGRISLYYGSGTVSKPGVGRPGIEAAPRVVDIGIGLDARELAAELNGVLA